MSASSNTMKPPARMFKLYALATRPMFLTASILPVLLGTALVVGRSDQGLDVIAFLLALGATICVHAAANVLNDIFDDKNGSDRINTRRISPFTGGSRMIQDGLLDQRQMTRLAVILLIAAMSLGIALALYSGPIVILLGLLGILAGMLYSMPPFQLVNRGFGESTVAFAFGILPVVGAAWLQAEKFDLNFVLLSLPVALWVVNILLVNEIPDTDADAKSGKRTLAVRLGSEASALVYWILNLFAVLAILEAYTVFAWHWSVNIIPMGAMIPVSFAAYKIYWWDRGGKDSPQTYVLAIKITLSVHALNILWLTTWALLD